MRLKIEAIKLNQVPKINIYLTKLNVGQLKKLYGDKQIISDKYDPDLEETGYNREISEGRAKKVLWYLSKNFEIILPILPSSIVMNVRKKTLKFKNNKLLIGDDAVFYIVDGQHRLEGLRQYKKNGYEVPVTILENLENYQEAAQFLIINSTQKRVDPQLQLRVLFKTDELGLNKLIKEIKEVLPLNAWKLKALKIVVGLEKAGSSPWFDLVKLPNESVGSNEWKPIKEGSFLDSLRSVCSNESSLENLDDDKKIRYLIQYWNSIKKMYPEAFDKKTGDDYLICRGLGAGVFNTFFPIAFMLLQVGVVKDFDELSYKIKRNYPLRRWSRVKRSYFSKIGTGQGAFKQMAEEFLLKMCPQLDYINGREYDKLTRRGKFKNELKKAYNMMRPIHLKHIDFLEEDIRQYAFGCYILINLKKDQIKVYAGQSENVKKRLKNHNKEYKLYAVVSCRDKKELDLLEGILYHLVKPNVRENKVHPNKEYCIFCK